jgi:multidrug efflux system outer membrane protein
MKYNKIISILFLMGTIFSSLYSQEALSLTLEECLERALMNNRDFQISLITLEGTRREEVNKWNKFLPGVSTSTRLIRSDPLFSTPQGEPNVQFSGAVSLGLSLSPSLIPTLKDKTLSYERELIHNKTAREQLAVQVEKEFYFLIASANSIDIQKKNLDLARARYEQTLRNFEMGLASRLSTLQSQVTAANLEPAYLQTAADYRERIRNFCLILGLPSKTELVLDGSLEVDEFTGNGRNLAVRFIPNRRDIQYIQKNLEILRNQKNIISLGSQTPSLNLSADWSTGVNSPFDPSSWQPGTWSDNSSLSLSLSLPLDVFLPGSQASLSIKSADDQIKKAVIDLDRSMEQAETEIINLVSQLETSLANMKLSRLNRDLAQLSYEMSEESYNRGSIERLAVEDAQQAFLTADQFFLQSQYEYLITQIDLRMALGLESRDQLP